MATIKDGILGIIIGAHALWLRGDLRGVKANLREANLSGANLRGANLGGASLRWAIGNGSPDMLCIQDHWHVVMTKDTMAIGCQQHSITSWWEFSDTEIGRMDSRALEWWATHKPVLQALHTAKWGDK